MRGRRPFCERPLPRAPSRKGGEGGETPGEAASLREAPPPEPPSRRAAGNRLVRSFGGSRPCELGAFSYGWVEVTAADRAAAPSQLEGNGKMLRILPPSRPQTRPTPHGRGGSVSRRDLNQATVFRAHLQAEPSQQNRTSRTPHALRERGSGGEALLSEKRPLPQNLLHTVSSGGSAREGASCQRSPLPRNHSPTKKLDNLVGLTYAGTANW